MRQRLEVLPERGSGTGAPPEHSGPRAGELPELLPAGSQSISLTVPAEQAAEDDPE
jgi:hypothetical protein